MKDSDLIIVIEEGRVAETGDHGQLLDLGGLYARLYERQLISQELETL